MNNYFDLSGKYALVVGASSGLGRQFAKALARQGATVAIAARRADKLGETKRQVEELGGKCIAVSCDVSNEESVIKCVEEVMNAFGRIDILCNNAGIATFGEFTDIPTNDWDRTFDVNIRGMFLMTREVGKVMKQQNYGKIINTASISAHGGDPVTVAYCASKAAVVNFTRAVATSLGQYNVTVNSIAPGVFASEITENDLDGPMTKAYINSVPLHRIGNEGELDGALIYFASDASAYCTGQTLYVDGGKTAL